MRREKVQRIVPHVGEWYRPGNTANGLQPASPDRILPDRIVVLYFGVLPDAIPADGAPLASSSAAGDKVSRIRIQLQHRRQYPSNSGPRVPGRHPY